MPILDVYDTSFPTISRLKHTHRACSEISPDIRSNPVNRLGKTLPVFGKLWVAHKCATRDFDTRRLRRRNLSRVAVIRVAALARTYLIINLDFLNKSI